MDKEFLVDVLSGLLKGLGLYAPSKKVLMGYEESVLKAVIEIIRECRKRYEKL